MKVLFYTNIPSPYRVAFFNELGKYCDLTVVFETAVSTERDDAWKEFEFKNFKGIILKGIRTRVDAAFCPSIIKYLKKNAYDHIVVTQLASFTAIWAVAFMRLVGISYCYEGDGGFVGSVKGLKAYLKQFIIKNADYCFSTSKTFDDYCVAYGAKKERIFRYPFSSVFEDSVRNSPVEWNEKIKIRKELGIAEDKMLLAVGQFIYRKGFDLLLEMSRTLKDNVGVYIIGGKPTEEYLKMKEQWNLQNVHFVDFMSKEDLEQYYLASDIFVFPTREDIWGLVINEAMACGLPVISTEGCIAALELIKNDENGYIVPVNDSDALRLAVKKIIDSEQKCKEMSEYALKTIRNNYTIESMALTHMDVFRKENRGS